jgi:PIN domain nuclease of toxin-antitoxin system
MKYLLDTHTFIWAISDTGKLSERALKIIMDKDSDIYVSVLSFWEISLKTSIKKFFLEGINISELPQYAQKMDFGILNLYARATSTFAGLPSKDNHKDPFDRMVIWQAITEKMILISKDRLFEQYSKDGLAIAW